MANVLGNVDWYGMTGTLLAKTAYWLGIILVSALLIALLVVAYYYFTFNYSMLVFPLYGSGKDGVFSVGRPKKNRVKWVNKRTAWRKLKPYFNRKDEEPFDSEFIYPGKKLYAFDLNGNLIPGRINIKQSEGQIRAEINPVPHYVRNWQSLQHKKNAIEFAKHDWWTDNKALFITLIICGINLALCAFVIWFTYKYAMGGREDIQNLARIIQDIGSIPAAPG